MTYNRMKFGVGVFILLFILNVTVVVYYILDEKGVFDKRYNYSFSTFSADPFTIGMPVKVSGFKIGYVDKIQLENDGSVKISFSVNKQNQKWVLKESIIMIRKPLLGSAQIVLYPAVDNPVLEDGSKIEVYESNDINEVIYKLQPIVEKIENIVSSVDKITSYLARDDSELVKIVKNLEEFTTTLAKNRSVLTTITGDQNATNSLIKTVNGLPVLIDNFSKIGSGVNDEVIPNVNLLIKDLSKIGTGVNSEIIPNLNLFIKDLRGIVTDVNSKLKRLDGLVNSVGSYDSDIMILKDEIKTGIVKSNKILEKVDTLLPAKKQMEVELP